MREFLDAIRIIVLLPYMIVQLRIIDPLVKRFDKRPKRFLHFTWSGVTPLEQIYPVVGPWNARTALKHGKAWIAKEVVVESDGSWSFEDSSGQWYFSDYSAPYWDDLDAPGYEVLTDDGRRSPDSL